MNLVRKRTSSALAISYLDLRSGFPQGFHDSLVRVDMEAGLQRRRITTTQDNSLCVWAHDGNFLQFFGVEGKDGMFVAEQDNRLSSNLA